MAILTQGTQLYALMPTDADPAVLEVVAIPCATAFTPGGDPADQIETTCLESRTRTYMPGLRTPAVASLTINFDPAYPEHVRMLRLSQRDPSPSMLWALGWSDGEVAPTVSTEGDDFELPADRTWWVTEGYLSDVPFDVTGNSVVTSTASIQRTAGGVLIPKADAP